MRNPADSSTMNSGVQARAYAAFDTTSPLKPFAFQRRSPEKTDVQIKILFCGICHSDLHWVKGDWGPQTYPVVPGHEIVGRVESVGSGVQKFKVGDLVGVGCLVDSCRSCVNCQEDEEQYCERGGTFTYGSRDPRGGITQGGYASHIVVEERFVLRVPEKLSPAAAAPLLCAGITTYSPLKHWNTGPGTQVAVAGLGGLGHMAVKIARAMGAHVTVLSTSTKKQKDAERLGAHDFIALSSERDFAQAAKKFDLIINTISASHSYDAYLSLLKKNGTMVLVGLPGPQPVQAFSLVGGRRRLAGSLIGGLRETQEMLDFCSQHGIAAEVETVKPEQINSAYERLLKNDVQYRFVIDLQEI
ncbi:MAG TPA: NAD(P)-dependent alcohol dehydrogenase [Pseudobdellovibrionaceae bacterium]|nr:NAD(P)-dependent alcohol dehydrogenase [Pseudobdellovibrionaceae bacterium]